MTTHVLDVRLNANQAVVGGPDVIVWNTVVVDDLGAYNTVTGRFTPTVAGFWFFQAFVLVSGASAAYDVIIRQNGSDVFFNRVIGTSATIWAPGLLTFNGTTDYMDVTLTGVTVTAVGSVSTFSHLLGTFLGVP